MWTNLAYSLSQKEFLLRPALISDKDLIVELDGKETVRALDPLHIVYSDPESIKKQLSDLSEIEKERIAQQVASYLPDANNFVVLVI